MLPLLHAALGVIIYVSGAVNAQANVVSFTGVQSVQWQLDTQNFGAQETSAPYILQFNTATIAEGPHVLSVIATDTGGNTGAATAQIVVANKPVVDIQIH